MALEVRVWRPGQRLLEVSEMVEWVIFSFLERGFGGVVWLVGWSVSRSVIMFWGNVRGADLNG